jgi:hypothetical protein
VTANRLALVALFAAGCAYRTPTQPAENTPTSTPAAITIAVVPPYVRVRVLDNVGHGVANQSVTLTTSAGTITPAIAITDILGQADATLTNAATATITASVNGLIASTVLNPSTTSGWTVTISSTTISPVTRDIVRFAYAFVPLSSSAPALSHASVTFGDGTGESIDLAVGLTAISHAYGQKGTYDIVLTVTDVNGAAYVATARIVVVDPKEDPPPPEPSYTVTVSANPASLTVGHSSTLTASVIRNNGAPAPDVYDWDCDGDGAFEGMTSGNVTTCTYTTAGSITSRAKARNGTTSGVGSTTITVTP